MCNKNIINVNESVSDPFQSIISALALGRLMKTRKSWCPRYMSNTKQMN